jgi:hypothetical protein
MYKTLIFALFLSLSLLSCLNTQYTLAQGVSPIEKISMERAKQIALEKVKGKIISAKTEKDDGITKYEIIVQAKDGRYEVEIDKATGKVLEVEKEGAGDDRGRDDDGHDDDDDKYDD